MTGREACAKSANPGWCWWWPGAGGGARWRPSGGGAARAAPPLNADERCWNLEVAARVPAQPRNSTNHRRQRRSTTSRAAHTPAHFAVTATATPICWPRTWTGSNPPHHAGPLTALAPGPARWAFCTTSTTLHTPSTPVAPVPTPSHALCFSPFPLALPQQAPSSVSRLVAPFNQIVRRSFQSLLLSGCHPPQHHQPPASTSSLDHLEQLGQQMQRPPTASAPHPAA
ncbi:hypothetical protein PCL_10661 [Purpureocillium lilacinum]|uniref:Uncharacterized protein n=1 Tax=Purpureocillium lilacinum TaxID=33203 RepID=A0A2U3EC11_PURLI|nr:hypothetical protein PCL_10661 [Purpureocillium lilacinum]